MSIGRWIFVIALLSSGEVLAGDRMPGPPSNLATAPRVRNSESGPLHASLIVEDVLGRDTADVLLTNSSGEFICISSRMFNTIYSHITLGDEAGKRIKQKSYGDPVPSAKLGFDYTDTYFFILPNETRKIGIDLQNFKISGRASYNYDLNFLYYRCRDVIDQSRIKMNKKVEPLALQARGKMVLHSEN